MTNANFNPEVKWGLELGLCTALIGRGMLNMMMSYSRECKTTRGFGDKVEIITFEYPAWPCLSRDVVAAATFWQQDRAGAGY